MKISNLMKILFFLEFHVHSFLFAVLSVSDMNVSYKVFRCSFLLSSQ